MDHQFSRFLLNKYLQIINKLGHKIIILESNKMLKLNKIKDILKVSSIFLILLQLSCVQNKNRENIIVASAGRIESLDPAQANTLRTLQILSALGDTLYKINKEGNLSPYLAKDLPEVSNYF